MASDYGDLLFEVEWVPIPSVSVRCDLWGVELRAPGGDGETGDGWVSPSSMSLISLFSTDIDRALHETVREASDGAEVLDEVCRMVINELDRLSAQLSRYGGLSTAK